MNDRRPDLGELVGDLPPEERVRLERVHELLVAAGPPPELSPALAETPRATVMSFPRRHRALAIGIAAVLALGLLGTGYAVGHGTAPETAFTVPMTGPGGASAEIAVFEQDAAGNWPMKVTVRGLPTLEGGRRYELWLTKAGKLEDRCGTFSVSADETEVPLNAPYVLRDYDGWVVVVTGSQTPVLHTLTV